MGLNTFVDYSTSSMMSAQEAELYMRIYQYAAEDFRAVSDCSTAHQGIVAFATGLNAQLSSVVNSHFHIASGPGAPTSPSTIPFIPGPPPIQAVNTTGVPDNIIANVVIPAGKLSYIDARAVGSKNVIVSYLRRGKEIPIAKGGMAVIGSRF